VWGFFAEGKLLPRPATGSCEGSRPGYLVPNPEPLTTELSEISGGEQVASGTEVRGNDTVHLDKTLGVPSGLELSHSPLPLPRRLRRVLGPVVYIPVLSMSNTGHHDPFRRPIAAQFVGNDHA
jgi:hypothetical protein